jgi:hypothetical protein
MPRLSHPLKMHIYVREDERTLRDYVAPVQESELPFLANSARVAYGMQRCGGVSGPECFETVIEPIKRCDCAPDTPEDAERMSRLGCIVSELSVRLEAGGAVVFEHRQPMTRLSPVASSLCNRLGLRRQKNSDAHDEQTGDGDSQPNTLLWQLTADFLTPLPGTPPGGVDDEGVDLEEPEPLGQVTEVRSPPEGETLGDQPPGDVRVFIRSAGLETMVRHAREAPEDLEVGGALLGRIMRDAQGIFVLVEDTPLLPTQGSTYAVTFGSAAFQRAHELLRESEQTLLGLWHVHPACLKETFASEQDLYGFETWWNEPWHIFAVAGRSPEQTAFFGWSRDGQARRVAFCVTGDAPAACKEER